MEVYGDLYFFVNALCDLLLLTLVCLLLRRKAKKRRLIASSLVGGAFALLSLWLPRAAVLLLSLPVAALMVLLAFSFGCLRDYLLSCLVFFGASFFLSGAVNFCASLLNRRLPPAASLLILLAALALGNIAALLCYEAVKRRARVLSVDLSFTYADRVYACPALVDSGNLLCDAGSGLPVILFDPSFFDLPAGGETIRVNTAAGSEVLPLFSPAALTVDGAPARAMGAVCRAPGGFSGFQALLPSSLVKTPRKKGFLCLHSSKN